jgi:hypothetical protein
VYKTEQVAFGSGYAYRVLALRPQSSSSLESLVLLCSFLFPCGFHLLALWSSFLHSLPLEVGSRAWRRKGSFPRADLRLAFGGKGRCSSASRWRSCGAFLLLRAWLQAPLASVRVGASLLIWFGAPKPSSEHCPPHSVFHHAM